MADLVLNTMPMTRPAGGRDSFPIAHGVTLGVGALVELASGYLNHWSDGNNPFIGIVIGGDFTTTTGLLTGDTGADLPPEATVDTSGVTLMHIATLGGTPVQAEVGDLVYAADSNLATATLTDTTNAPVGRMTRWTTATDVEITLFTPGAHAAGMAAATW